MRGSIQKSKNSCSSKGFSLIELMIAMTIVLIVLGVLASIMAGINNQFKTQRPRLEAVSNGQTAADTIVRLIRMAGNRPLNCVSTFLVSTPVPSAALANGYFGSLRIQSDWNAPDCTLNGVEEDVTFSAANNVFYLDAARQNPFVDKISALRFKLFDKDNAVITDPNLATNTKLIRVEVDTIASDGTLTTITSGASIRK
jgi:prepilin-type N-terminal cleavage/methylation domain-containing protein